MPSGDVLSLSSLAGQFALKTGISNPFSDTAFLPYAYRQAEIALASFTECGKDGVCRYADCITTNMVRLCLAKYPKAFFAHPILTQIQEYDAKYNLHYLETLKTYLLCAGSLKETAAALNIHYNTVKYRMRTIEDIAGQRISGQGELLLTLQLSMLTWEAG